MKKIILLVAVFFASTIVWTVAAQCSTTGNASYWGQYPTATQSAPTALGVETTITSNNWAGEYYRVSGLIAGAVYNWSLCGASYDTQLTIRNWNTGAVVAYNDDSCGVASTTTFTSDGSDLRIQINRYFCYYNFTSTATRATLISEPLIVGDPPLIQCPSDVVVTNDAGQCGAIVNFADAVAIDPDGDLDVVLQTSGLPSGSEFPVGVNTVAFTAYDLGGNIATCSFTITVEDNEFPVIECLSEYTVELGTDGTYTIDPEELLASFSDNCGSLTYTVDGALVPVAGSLETTFAGGNGGAAGGAVFFDLTAIESVAMTSFLTHLQGSGGTAFSMDIYVIPGGSYVGNTTNPGAWTNIGAVTGISQPDGTPSEAFPPAGYTVDVVAGVTYGVALVLDAGHAHRYTSGNGSNGDFANDDLALSLGAAQNTPFSSGAFSPRLWNGGINYEKLIVGGNQDTLLECSDIGVVGMSVTATDAAGNSVTCSTLITVQDTTAPEIICAGQPIVGDILEDFESGSLPNGWTNTALRGTDLWVFNTGAIPGTGGGFPTLAATFDDDAAGPSTDNAVQLTSPAYNMTGAISASLSFDYAYNYLGGNEFFSVEVYDGAAWQEILRLQEDHAPTNTGALDMLPYANANFQVRYTFDDGGSAWMWGVGIDNFQLNYDIPSTPLTIALDANGMATLDVSQLILSVTDNCGSVSTSIGGSSLPGSLSTTLLDNNGGAAGGAVYFDVTVGSTDLTLTAIDIHTNDLDAFTLEIYTLEGTYVGNENNASAWTLTTTGSGVSAGPDAASNAVLDTQVTLVAGTTYGMAVVLDATHGHRYTNGDGTNENYSNADLSLSAGAATTIPFEGNVFSPRVFNGGLYYVVGTPASTTIDFDCSNLGDNFVEVTATDAAGNVSTCISTVEIVDVTDPILVCQDATVSLDENGMAEVLPEYFIDAAASFDNCGITITAVDVTDVTCADIGASITVTVFVSDSSGNIASCQAVMTVVDDMGPILENCPADMTVDPGTVDLFYEVPDYTAGVTATDNCTDPMGAITQDPVAGTLLPDGVYTVTLSATDNEGNVGTCSFELTVESQLGVASNQLDNGVAIYPNPARNVMNIGNSTNIQLERAAIYDINGRLIQTVDLSAMGTEASVNVAHLASGVYMVQLQAENGQAIKRLVKE